MLSLQMVWFVVIVKKIVQFLTSDEHLKSPVPVLCGSGDKTVYQNRIGMSSKYMSRIPNGIKQKL